LDTFGAQVSSDHERYPADVKCLGFLYLYVGRYPRNNASRNTVIATQKLDKRQSKVGKLFLVGCLRGVWGSRLGIFQARANRSGQPNDNF
ncbi:MAG: hypothetical protein BECKG1743D_GA0114223_112362, partial [Candidatus Kentron sp. G]